MKIRNETKARNEKRKKKKEVWKQKNKFVRTMAFDFRLILLDFAIDFAIFTTWLRTCGWTDGQTDGQNNGQTDRMMGGETNKCMDMQHTCKK